MKRWLICVMLVMATVTVGNTHVATSSYDAGQKLFLITLDGFRWQELFSGADPSLLRNPSFTPPGSESIAAFDGASTIVRRQKLMPFFWSVLAREGQLHGNRRFGNQVNVANPYALSYPGYNELLTGKIDLMLWGNEPRRNNHPTVLQHLAQAPAYAGRVAAFASWELFPYILHQGRELFSLNAGAPPVKEGKETRADTATVGACKKYLLNKSPSIVFLSLSGTDDAGHDRRYDEYLRQAHTADRLIGELWKLVQSLPAYAGRTTFLITTDHGRGRGAQWHSHGLLVGGSSETWFALLGSRVLPAGERKEEARRYQWELKDLMLSLLKP
jgi:hypothetical protein